MPRVKLVACNADTDSSVQCHISVTEGGETGFVKQVNENFDNTFIQYRSDLVQGLTALSSSGINVIDLGPVLGTVSETMFTDDSHFNDSGYREIAKTLYRVIRQNNDNYVNDI